MKITRLHLLLPAILSLTIAASAQTVPPQDKWGPLRYFIGAWEGTGAGQPGAAKVEREYQLVLNGQFLQVRNQSTYAPQPKNPKGERHEDWGLFSFDRGRKQFVFRQFHAEGFVNQYAMAHTKPDGAPDGDTGGKTLVFTTESIENIPPGWRARETYKIINNDEFIEVFELAAPGKEFEVYSENRLKRKQTTPAEPKSKTPAKNN
jgi:hypothetical protein